MKAQFVSRANRKWWTLGALTFSLFMIMLDNTVVNVALPAIQGDLNIGLSQLEWTINAYALTYAVLLLLGGKLSDYFGRRRIFLVGLAVFGGSSLVCGLATSGAMLIGARAVQGVGSALMMPATLSVIMVTFPRRQRGLAIGIWASVSLVALAVGPLVGGILIQQASWNWIFFVNVPIGAVGIVVGRLVIPESRDTSMEQRLDVLGLLASGAALFALTFAVIEADRYGWGSGTIVGCFIGAAVGLVLFVVLELRQRLPMLDLRLFKNTTFAGANLVALLVMLVMFGIFFFTSIYLQVVLGYSPVQAGATFLPLTCILVAAAPIAGRFSDRIGSRWLMSGGLCLIGTALLMMSRFGLHATFWDIVPELLLGGFGIGLTMTPTTAAVLGAAPIDKSGVASGVLDTFRQLGGVLGIAIMGAIVAHSLGGVRSSDPRFALHFVNGFQHALMVAGFVAFGGSLAAAFLVGQYRRLDAPEIAEAGI